MDVVVELRAVQSALESSMLALLRGQTAALRVALMVAGFPDDRRAMPTHEVHQRIDAALAELARAGNELPKKTASDYGREWLKENWLTTRPLGAGAGEEYALTSHALEALDLVKSLTDDRIQVGESRILTIVEAIRNAALAADPTRESRIARYDARIASLEAERDRLLGGGAIEVASVDQMVDRYYDLIQLLRQLPADLKRLSEDTERTHRAIHADFVADTRPKAETLTDYLVRVDELANGSEAGQAFTSSCELLRDDDMVRQLRADLDLWLQHEFADGLLPSEKAELRSAIRMIRSNVEDVLARRHRGSAMLRDFIQTRDAAQEREIDDVLRQLETRLNQLIGGGHRGELDLLPDTVAALPHAKEKFFDFAAVAPPPPLEELPEPADMPVFTLEELRLMGGPQLDELRAGLAAAKARGVETIGAAFNGFPNSLRRPVEIFGLLHIAAEADGPRESANNEVFETIRPDGTRRRFTVPRLPIPAGLTAKDVQ